MPVATSRWRPSSVSLSACRLSQGCNLGLDRLRQQRSRAIAQYLGQRIDKSSWLRELENISLGHGVSLLRWRSGGVEHPHDTPPYPFRPSPTFAHSSADTVNSCPPRASPYRSVPLTVGLAMALVPHAVCDCSAVVVVSNTDDRTARNHRTVRHQDG